MLQDDAGVLHFRLLLCGGVALDDAGLLQFWLLLCGVQVVRGSHLLRTFEAARIEFGRVAISKSIALIRLGGL